MFTEHPVTLLGSNTISLLQNLRPEDDHPSFMPRHAANPPSKSTLRQRRVLESACSDKIMHRCSNCVRRSKACKIGSHSDSCTECAGMGLSCELAFSEAKLRCIRKKRREKLEAARLAASQIQELVARQSRLYTEADNLEKQEEELVRRELQNIEELEAEEAAPIAKSDASVSILAGWLL